MTFKKTLVWLSVLSGCASSQEASVSDPHAHPHHQAHHHGQGHAKGFHHRFEDAEAWSKRFDAKERDAWQKPQEVVQLAEIQPGATVADIGAGTGYFLPYLSQAVGGEGKVWALDVEPNLVKFMSARIQKEALSNAEARLVPFDSPLLEAGSTDRILIVDTWHHIDHRLAYAKKLAEALKPGGRVVIVDFTQESEMGPPPAHRLSPEAVQKELEAGGLSTRVLEESLPNQFIVVGERQS